MGSASPPPLYYTTTQAHVGADQHSTWPTGKGPQGFAELEAKLGFARLKEKLVLLLLLQISFPQIIFRIRCQRGGPLRIYQ